MLHRLFKKIEYADGQIQTDYDDTPDRLASLQIRYNKLKETHKRLEEEYGKTKDKLYLTENKLKSTLDELNITKNFLNESQQQVKRLEEERNKLRLLAEDNHAKANSAIKDMKTA